MIRHTLPRPAPRLAGLALALALALPGWLPAQSPTVETAPLEPPAPRLPGGTVLEQGETRPLPGALGPDGLPLAPSEGEGAEDEALLENDAPGDEIAIFGPEPGFGEGAAQGEGQGEAAEPRLLDLFKRAPPGTGGVGPVAPELIEPVARAGGAGAVIRELDKLTGVIETFELAPGEEKEVARLRIALVECRAPVSGATSDNIAFLRIWDTKHPEAPPVFSGWMFADSPALSAMDHPRYDVWLISCKTAAGSESAAKR